MKRTVHIPNPPHHYQSCVLTQDWDLMAGHLEIASPHVHLGLQWHLGTDLMFGCILNFQINLNVFWPRPHPVTSYSGKIELFSNLFEANVATPVLFCIHHHEVNLSLFSNLSETNVTMPCLLYMSSCPIHSVFYTGKYEFSNGRGCVHKPPWQCFLASHQDVITVTINYY